MHNCEDGPATIFAPGMPDNGARERTALRHRLQLLSSLTRKGPVPLRERAVSSEPVGVSPGYGVPGMERQLHFQQQR